MSRGRSSRLLFAFLLVFLRAANLAWPQCESWRSGFANPLPGADWNVKALAVLDDGSGPTLCAGGGFTEIGDVQVQRVARWDGEIWTPFGSGLTHSLFFNEVEALTVFDDGSGPALVAGGLFNRSGTTFLNNVARWNGTSWQSLGSGLGNPGDHQDMVLDLCVFDDGTGPNLYACGRFNLGPGGSGIARWNGSSWSLLAGGTNSICNAMAVFDDGSGPALFIGGYFTSAGGVPANRIVKWDGGSFSPLGSGVDLAVHDLIVHDDGSGPALFVGGDFQNAGGAPASEIAKWDGASWSPLGVGVSPNSVLGLTVFDDGSGPALHVIGNFSYAGGASALGAAKWDGVSWSALGAGVGFPSCAISFDDGTGPNLVVGGWFSSAGGQPAGRIAGWDGSSWRPLAPPAGDGVIGTPYSFAIFDDGTGPATYVGGYLEFDDPAVRGIAKWNGSGWTGIGSTPGYGWIFSQLAADLGSGARLYAAGNFYSIGGVAAKNIASWDGSTWASLASGVGEDGDSITALVSHDEGAGPRIFVGGVNTVGGQSAGGMARWDGSSWSTVGTGVTGTVKALASWNDGGGPTLFVGGNFTTAGGNPASCMARWNGSAWSPVGTGMNDVVRALKVFDDGSGEALYAAGNFTTAGGVAASRVARWNGASWSPLGSGFASVVYALVVHDDGSGPALYAGGEFVNSGTTSTRHLARWNGASWAPLGAGTDGPVLAMASLAGAPSVGSDLWIGGEFTRAAELPSAHVAVWRGCAEPVDRFCFGDGSVAPCPCSNAGVQSRGCNNSQNTGGARLYTSGSTIPDTLVLHAVAELPTSLTIVLQGDALIPGSVAFGDGVRCVGGHLKRLYSKNASGGSVVAPGSGDPSITARSAALGDPIPSGGVRYYTAYYRDPNPGFCPIPTGNTFNAGNGVRVVW